MRKVTYKVMTPSGMSFHTVSFREATECGNRIIETYLVPMNEVSEGQKEKNQEHARKVREFFARKRAKKRG